ncbi:MAG: CPBP family intramembrane metalloprotease [Acholeplasmataceae bacterium]|nr:CPBP family intramembrane metalloprotease [Acholeplasmataceae bacterium]
MTPKSSETRKSFSFKKIVLLLLTITMLVIVFGKFDYFGKSVNNEIAEAIILRILGGIFLIIVLIDFGYGGLFKVTNFYSSLLIALPALLISVNNFPFSAYFNGRFIDNSSKGQFSLFLMEAFSVGFFEELLFRVVVLIFLNEFLKKSAAKKYLLVLISAAIFSFLHLLNLISGADLMATLLQMGYSFLMGALWAVIYLKTKNLYLIIFLHSSYNFFGEILFKLGTVSGIWDLLTLFLTSGLALLTALHTIWVLKTLTKNEDFFVLNENK